MKKIIIAIFIILMPVLSVRGDVVPLFVYPDVLEYAINKHFSVMDRDRVAQEWENRMNASDGTVTADDIKAVCKVGRIDDKKCSEFQKDLMTYFYDVCEKSAGKGKSDCVKDFWAAAWGTWVRLPEAIGIAKEYALVKNKETVVCSTNVRNVNPPARASYVKCTSVDGKHFYEYKYNSTTETKDRDIISGTLRAVGKIHGVEFQNSDCTLERIYSDSNCALSYKTSDGGQCEKINKSLNRFGYSAKVVNTDKFGKRCEVFGLSGGNRTAYGIDNTVFKDVQYVAGPEVENRIKAYVQKELSRQNVKLQTFKCDSSTKHIYNTTMLDGLVKEHSEVLTCYVNGSPIDFIFDDLSEGKGYAKDAGLSKMACAQIGGKIDGRDCRGLDEIECLRISNKIPGGTRWDDKAEVCILNKVDIDKKINDRIQILGGLVLAVGIGAVIAPEVAAATGISETSFILLSGVGSVVTDEGFIQIERLEELKPAKYAHEFVSDALMCGIPTGTTRCNRTEVECAMGVVSKHFGRLDEIIDKLNDSQLQSVVEAMINVTDCLDKDQFATALNTVTIETNLKDKIVNQAGLLWLIAGIFVSPENTVTKLAARAPKIARVLNRCIVVERVSGTLDGAKYMRIYVDNLDTNDIKKLVNEFRKRGIYVSSNVVEKTKRRFLGVADMDIFGNWQNSSGNWLLVMDDIITKYNGELRRGSKTIKGDYYRFYVNPKADNSQLINDLKAHGFYISSNQTDDSFFIAASHENVFGPWEKDINNWLKYGVAQSLSNDLKHATGLNFEYKSATESGLHVNHYRINVSGKSETEIQKIQKQLVNAGFGGQIEVIDTNKGKLLVVYEQPGVRRTTDIFDKVYDDIPDDVLQQKLDYVNSHSATHADAIKALKRVGAFDENRAFQLSVDVADEAINKIRYNNGFIDRMKRWKSLSVDERKTLALELHENITGIRRKRVGNTIIDIVDDPTSGRNGAEWDPKGVFARKFEYNIGRPTVQDLLTTIIHENTHAWQNVGKSSIHPCFIDFADRHYVQPNVNYDLYYNNVIEVEARYVGENAASRIMVALGI